MIMNVAEDNFQRVFAHERSFPGHCLVKNRAKRIQVRSCVSAASHSDFWGYICDCADDDAVIYIFKFPDYVVTWIIIFVKRLHDNIFGFPNYIVMGHN